MFSDFVFQIIKNFVCLSLKWEATNSMESWF